MACHYCGQTHTKDYANDSVIDKYFGRTKYLIEQKPNYKGLAITWYEGEPLMGLKAIKKMINFCKEKNLNYISDMVTNGLSLKSNVFETLVKECLVTDYQITIDGIAESHDKRRITKSGEPTFDIIIKNIMDVTSMDIYSEYNCNIQIRVNVDKTNCQYVEPLIHFIKDKNLQSKVSMYFAPIVDFGSNNASKNSLNRKFFSEKEIEWLYLCYEGGIKINILPERVYGVYMVENKDSEVYDVFGNIYACWEFPYDKQYSKGEG